MSAVLVSTPTDALTRFGHAMSDLTRTQVLLRLREGPAYPAELADLFGVTRQRISALLREGTPEAEEAGGPVQGTAPS